MSILEEIFAHKRIEISEARLKMPGTKLADQIRDMPAPIDFKEALKNDVRPAPRLIAEVKHKSPSKGILSKNFDPTGLAKTYAGNGAAAISILTDNKYFGGSLEIMNKIYELRLGLPLLRKDFIFDPYQLLEARAAGASAVLLIAAMLEQDTLVDLIQESAALEMIALVEAHDEDELERALMAGAQVIGINNRNLHDFSVSLETSFRLAKLCPPEITLVSESGIKDPEDIKRLAQANVDAILVGEALVTANDVGEKVRSLTRVKVR